MSNTPTDLTVPEVFEGKGVAIHVAPEGIALSGRRVARGAPLQQVARYSEVADVRVEGHARARLVVKLRDDQGAWVVPGMRRSHALWAQRLILVHLKRAERRGLWAQQHLPDHLRGEERETLTLFSRRLGAPEFAEALDKLLNSGFSDIPDITHLLLAQAAMRAASDLHLVPTGDSCRVQWRVDGVLAEACQLPPDIGQRVVARLKVLAGLVGYRHDIIQEGRFVLDLRTPRPVRLTILPTLHGESATVRLYQPDGGLLPLDQLGFDPEDLGAYRRLISRPDGLMVLTGPAGAGKTTTMYGSLQDLDEQSQGGLSFATVEEPVEHDLGFAAQTAVNDAAGLDFASALAATLRQDPNVIMVGEIRDPETAQIAVRAGMTGHLVFTTLHAAGAAGVFPRLAELGVAPSQSASAVRGIVSQRLLRRLCVCAETARPGQGLLRSLGLEGQDLSGWDLKSAQGCGDCEQTGYSGRVGVFQLALVGPQLADCALRGGAVREFEEVLQAQGVPGLHDRALRKARQGVVSLEEIGRVLGSVT